MDLTILIFITLFVVACFSLFLVYKFGIKEKSYEEALAEQRQQTSTLLGTKSKQKEKKNKKATKKPAKEKIQKSDSEGMENNEDKENTLPTKPHVEFKEPEEVTVKNDLNVLIVKEAKKSEEIIKQDPVKPKVTKEKKQNQEAHTVASKNKKNSTKPLTDIPKTEPTLNPLPPPEEKLVVEVIPAVTLPPTNGVVNTGKEKKKKKSEFNTKQQLTAERDELINSVRKAELSKTEIQLLIDLLLNKQLEAPAVIDEWSEGKSDPIQKLKKQLAEKEKLLTQEQEALAGAQAKLREIRSEQQSEKVQLQQKIRGLEEMVQTKQIEIQAANNRFQVNAQKIQQLQAELNAEILTARKAMEENAALQMQAKQYEVSLSQIQDTESIIGKLKLNIDELSVQNQQLQQMLAEKDHQYQHTLIQMAGLEKGYKELERNIEMQLRQETEWKREITNLNSALQKEFEAQEILEHNLAQLEEDLRVCNNEKSQLKSELQQAKEEVNRLGNLSDGKNNREVEILNLSNELSSTRNELTSRIEELQQTEKKYKTELETSNKKYLMVQKDLENQNQQNDKTTSELVAKQQESQKQFMQRLFPEIEDLKAINADDWQDRYAQLINNYLSNIKENHKQSSQTPLSSPPPSPQNSSEVAKLQSQLLHYKNIIDDTEGMLNKLQQHVEQEEMNWRSQLAAKEAELEHIKESCISQLQTKLLNVENNLSKEVEEKQRLLEECQLLKSQKPHTGANGDSLATVEKLSEEVIQLREQLREEQTKNGDIGVCLKTQNCNNSTNGPVFIEHCLSSSSSIASSLIEEYKKPKNKKRKKKVPSIKKSTICSNMGCQFLYCDGNSCGNNN